MLLILSSQKDLYIVHVSKKQLPVLYSILIYKFGNYFLDIQYQYFGSDSYYHIMLVHVCVISYNQTLFNFFFKVCMNYDWLIACKTGPLKIRIASVMSKRKAIIVCPFKYLLRRIIHNLFCSRVLKTTPLMTQNRQRNCN